MHYDIYVFSVISILSLAFAMKNTLCLNRACSLHRRNSRDLIIERLETSVGRFTLVKHRRLARGDFHFVLITSQRRSLLWCGPVFHMNR